MVDLKTKTFTQIVQDYAAAAQAGAAIIIDFTVGSISLAYAEAVADVTLWLQGLIAYVLTLRWASTSVGSDLDSWMADWGLFRLPAVAATTSANLTRLTPTLRAVCPIGYEIATTDKSKLFRVYLDTTNPYYSAPDGGYVAQPNVGTITVPVQAEVAGAAGNIQANTLTTLRSSTGGFDAVTNPAPALNGLDAESDPAFRDRFVLYLESLSKGTVGAIKFAIKSLQQNLQVEVASGADINGTLDPGMVTVVVDDGSGFLPDSVLAAAQAAVAGLDGVRAAGVRAGVYKASPLEVATVVAVTTDPSFYAPNVRAAVAAAVAAYVNGLGLGNPLDWSKISSIAWSIPGVTNVLNWTVAGGTVDIVPTIAQTIKSSSVDVE